MALLRQAIVALALVGVVSQEQQEPPPQPFSQEETYSVRFHVQLDADGTIEDGSFVVTVHPAWAPLGAARFAALVDSNFFVDTRFFRVVEDFVVQWGLPATPATAKLWRNQTLQDDPVIQSNLRGFVSFATSGANTRTTQLFINTRVDGNARLDELGFSPFGVIDAAGMAIVDRIYPHYGEQPSQSRISAEGNAYLRRHFPLLSWIRSVERCEGPRGVGLQHGCTVEDRVHHSGLLRVGSPFDFPPFSAWDGTVPVGLEVDLVQALATELG
jgi:peptidyl-prolyl cis-trans isomerase A (cyclophilin A)